MQSFKQYVTEAFNVWTHAEKPVEAGRKHIGDLKAAGHKILGHEVKDLAMNGKPYKNVSILSKDPAGKKVFHSISDITDRSDKRISASANSTRVMRGATKMHMSMKGKFHPDLPQ